MRRDHIASTSIRRTLGPNAHWEGSLFLTINVNANDSASLAKFVYYARESLPFTFSGIAENKRFFFLK